MSGASQSGLRILTALAFSRPPPRAIMDDRRNNREVVTVLFLCLMWYVVSSSSNVVGKMLLSEFPYPITVTMVQLTSITIYSGPFFNLWGVRRYASNITWRYYLRLIVPLALGKFLANVFSHVSIWKVPVSYAHTGTCSTILSRFHVCTCLCDMNKRTIAKMQKNIRSSLRHVRISSRASPCRKN